MSKTFKSLISVILAMLMFSGVLPFAFAASSGNSADSIRLGSIVQNGYSVKYEGGVDKTATEDPNSPTDGKTYPSSYDLRDYGYVTDPEAQDFGDCWTYGTMSSLESNALVQGFGEQHFSKAHLCYFTYTPKTEGQVSDDPWNEGGSPFYATGTLSNLEGIASKNDYPNMTEAAGYTFSESDRYNTGSGYILDSDIFLSETDRNEVKDWIMNNGAVAYTFCSVGESYVKSVDCEVLAYTDNTITNHVVTIVGWDDSVPAKVFNAGGETPDSNGAWIVKNSWYGDDEDYMLVSYCQFGIYNGLTVQENNVRRNYSHSERVYNNYFYDTSLEYAEVFKASGNEKISQVGYFVDSDRNITKATIKIKVYRHLVNNYTSPDNGVLAGEYTTTCTSDGYYTYDLPKEISLSKGEYFSVVIGCSDSKGCNVFAPCEGSNSQETHKGASGQSYIRLSDEEAFSDAYDTYNEKFGICNFFMHVYTECSHYQVQNADGTVTCKYCGEKFDELCTNHVSGEWVVKTSATTAHTGLMEHVCDVCGHVYETKEIAKLKNEPSIKIKNNSGSKTVNYGNILHLTVDAKNLPDNCVIIWTVDDESITGNDCYLNCYSDTDVKLTVMDSYGNSVLNSNDKAISDSEKVTVKSNIFFRIIAFFRSLFGNTKVIDQ